MGKLNDADRRDDPPEPSDPEAAKYLPCASCSGGLVARISQLNPHEARVYNDRLLYQMRTLAKTERKRSSEELLPKISYFYFLHKTTEKSGQLLRCVVQHSTLRNNNRSSGAKCRHSTQPVFRRRTKGGKPS